ncbi:MAG: hypothetical protein N2663_03785, partial [Chlorobi bacterium]|nr:hypothetical protein [Chlorobiota bacterium]
TVRYRVEAFDTLAIIGEPVLYRHRREDWLLRCDSTRGDTMFVQQRLATYWAREHTDSGDTSYRTMIPWVGKSVVLVITGRGHRVQVISPQTDSLGLVPGSIAGPTFFPPLDSVCTRCDQGVQWLAEQHDTLVEYAYPPARVERLYLGTVDSCTDRGKPLLLTIAETSRGQHIVRASEFVVQTAFWILAHGVVEIDTAASIPRRISYAQRARIAIKRGTTGKTKNGEQRTHANISAIETTQH